MRFTIRDVLWLMVVIGLSVGWWLDRRKLLASQGMFNERVIEAVKDTLRATGHEKLSRDATPEYP